MQKILAIGKIEVPKQLGFGVDTAEEEMLLNSLPVLTADMAQAAQQRDTNKLDMGDNEQIERDYNNNKQIELEKANRFAKVLDLRNANSAGIGFVNRQRIVKAFSTAENPFDPGRTEVQGTQPDQVHQICPFAQFRYYSRSFDLQNSKSMETSHSFQTWCWQSTKSPAARSSKG